MAAETDGVGAEPTFEGCKTIAAASGVPLEDVLRRAQLLPMTEGRPDLDELYERTAGLSPQNLATLTEVAKRLTAAERQVGEHRRYRVVASFPPPPSPDEFRRLLRRLSSEDREELLREWVESAHWARTDRRPGLSQLKVSVCFLGMDSSGNCSQS